MSGVSLEISADDFLPDFKESNLAEWSMGPTKICSQVVRVERRNWNRNAGVDSTPQWVPCNSLRLWVKDEVA